MSESITGYCPECGGSLFVGSGGYITCSSIECPNPTKVADLLLEREREHIVELREDTFSIRHPLREHPSDLLACGVHAYVSSLDGPPRRPGRYRVSGSTAPYVWQMIAVEVEATKEPS